jgi:dTDP-4-amino-4,6-dideoxygalactose transaminase
MDMELTMNPSPQDAGLSIAVPDSGSKMEAPRFVGGLAVSLRDFTARSAPDNVAHWFQGAEVHYVGAARTAIRKGLSLLDLKPGDEVLVPAYHCGSEIDVLLAAGLQVSLFSVSLAGEIDAEDLRRRITSRTRAVYVIHYFGFPQDLAPVVDLCRTRGLRLIEDCAVSTFTHVGARRLGLDGDIAVYNFPKMLPVPDGGALVVNALELRMPHWRLRSPPFVPALMGVIRLCKPALLRRLPSSAVRALSSRRVPSPDMAGGRLQMPASYYFDSAMQDRGISALSRRVLERTDLSQVIRRRRHNFSLLSRLVEGEPGLTPLFKNLPDGVCPLSFPVLVPGARDLARRLRAASIPAIAWWAGYHRAEFNWQEFPEARQLKDNVLALPVHHQMDEGSVRFVAARFLEARRHA